MNAVAAIGLFIGLPLLFGVIVYALVSAPTWLRSESGEDTPEGGPLLLTSARPLPDPGRLPIDRIPASAVKGGGISVRW